MPQPSITPTKAPPRPVDFMNQYTDFQCAMLASLGFSTDCIVRQTGLTVGQVTYRCGKARIKRADFRNGVSPIAGKILESTESIGLTRMLKRSLADGQA